MAFLATQKPPKWGFQAGLVAPEWAWFWDKRPNVFIPAWEGGGTKLFDIVNKNLTTATGTVDWLAGPKRRYIGNEYDDVATVPPFEYPITLIAYVEDPVQLSGSESSWYMGLVDNTSGSRMVTIGAEGTAGWRYFVRNGGVADSTDFVICDGGTQDANDHVVIGTSRSDGDNELFVDGISIELDTNTCTLFTPNQLSLGRLNDNTPGESLNAGLIYAAVLPAGFSQNEARILSRDPFGPFRMADEVGLFVPAAPPAGGRIMSSLVAAGGLVGEGGIAGTGGGLAG